MTVLLILLLICCTQTLPFTRDLQTYSTTKPSLQKYGEPVINAGYIKVPLQYTNITRSYSLQGSMESTSFEFLGIEASKLHLTYSFKVTSPQNGLVECLIMFPGGVPTIIFVINFKLYESMVKIRIDPLVTQSNSRK